MAWIYFQGLVESVSHSVNGLGPSLIVSKTDFAKRYSCPECNQANYQPHLSGMTCEHLELSLLIGQSTSSTVASPAKTLALATLVKVWRARAQDYFTRSCAYPKKSSPSLYSLKTCQQSENEVLEPLSPNWPPSGMTVGGQCYPLRKLERITNENAGSYWPTPTARDWKGMRRRLTNGKNISLTTGTQRGLDLCQAIGGNPNPNWVEWLMGYRTEWTVLEDWATQWYHSKRVKRSKDCVA